MLTRARSETKALRRPDEVRTFGKGKVEIFAIGGATIGRATFEPGWRWSTCVKPIAGTESCQAAHVGQQLSGTLRVKPDDGEEFDIKPGDFFSLPPGHDAWVVGDHTVVMVDFQGLADYARR